MSQLTELVAKLNEFTTRINALIRSKPAEAVHADDTDRLAGNTKAQVVAAGKAVVNAHANNISNPHNVTLSSLGGVNTAYVDSAIASMVSLADLPVSQYGDTSSDSLGITTDGWVLKFTKNIPAYIQGVSGIVELREISLFSINNEPANKEFHTYLHLDDGIPDYLVTTDKLPESAGVMYIGTVFTGTGGIASNSIGRVTRLGTYRLSHSARGSAIPVTGGDPHGPVRIDPAWTGTVTGSVQIATVPGTNPPLNAIAVSDEGGRIVYDSAWAKLFNNKWNSNWLTIEDIQPGPLGTVAKYLYNALRWVADPNRVGPTGGKVLVLGTSTYTNYSVTDTVDGNGLGMFIDGWVKLAGYTPVIKTEQDYNDSLSPTYDELDEYCAIIVSSGSRDRAGLFSEQAVTDIVNYKTSGGGIILFSEDGGPVLTSMASAIANITDGSGRQPTPNQIATRFGVWFSGEAGGDPIINIGQMRQMFGDHPLYAGMDDTENLNLGPSIARIKFDDAP